MKLLLDTHAFIWWATKPEKLSSKVQGLFADASNSLLLSVVSIWEIQIKSQLGKLQLNLPLRELVEAQQRVNGLWVLAIELEHVLALDSLPAHHKDPFDRLLIAQAAVEDASLVSKDNAFANYEVKLLW
jgi:PIN domain nuclease of toxin-antitoxin system